MYNCSWDTCKSELTASCKVVMAQNRWKSVFSLVASLGNEWRPMTGCLTNWTRFGRKRPWPNSSKIQGFACRDWVKPCETSEFPMFLQIFEPNTSRITATATLTRSVTSGVCSTAVSFQCRILKTNSVQLFRWRCQVTDRRTDMTCAESYPSCLAKNAKNCNSHVINHNNELPCF
jgi:hypothetical protein